MADCNFSFSSLSLSLLFLFPLIYYVIFHFISPTAKFKRSKTPTPGSYPLIGNLIGFLRNRHRFHDWVTDMLAATPTHTLQVNGFLGLSHGICTANPVNLHHLLRSNFPNFVKGHRFRSVLHQILGEGIFNVDGHPWSSQRKIASHEFNTRSLKAFISETVQSQLDGSLIPQLKSASDEKRTVDLQETLKKFGFDNICSVAFGYVVGSSKSSFMEAFDFAVEHSFSERFLAPVPGVWKVKRFLNIGSERKYSEAIGVIDEFAMSVIRSKERELETRGGVLESEDLLSRFMCSIADSDLGLGFGNEDEKRKFLRDIVISFVLAGKDSTSSALTWFFWLMAGHPHYQHHVYDELCTSVPNIASRKLSYDDLKNLHYLHAALSESMRLFPPVPINSRLTMEEDILPDKTRVGKGWFADYSAYAMGRMERLWGEDCREYKPERWLDADGIYQAPDPFKYPVFHCGPRMCLGKEMAYLQMKSVAAAVIYGFEVEALDGGGCPENMKNPPYTLSLLLKMRHGLPVRLKRRL